MQTARLLAFKVDKPLVQSDLAIRPKDILVDVIGTEDLELFKRLSADVYKGTGEHPTMMELSERALQTRNAEVIAYVLSQHFMCDQSAGGWSGERGFYVESWLADAVRKKDKWLVNVVCQVGFTLPCNTTNYFRKRALLSTLLGTAVATQDLEIIKTIYAKAADYLQKQTGRTYLEEAMGRVLAAGHTDLAMALATGNIDTDPTPSEKAPPGYSA